MVDPASHPCPKCRRSLRSSGTMNVEGGLVLPVFQCPECLCDWKVEGEVFETALTFAVDASGRALHPDTLEPLTL